MFSTQKINNINLNSLTSFVFALFPLSLILGNFSINFNLVLFCCLGIFCLKSKIFSTKFNFPIKIIFLFFIVILISTIISFIKSLYLEGYDHNELNRLVKSISFFRFFLMLLIVYFLSEHNILNFRYFLISSSFFVVLISLDIIFQYIFGVNTIGLKYVDSRHYSGFFGKELIAGAFIQNFSLYAVFVTSFLLRDKKIIRILFTCIVLSIFGAAIIVSGNRMSAIMFIFALVLTVILNRKFTGIILIGLFCFFLSFKLIISTNQQMDFHFKHMYLNLKKEQLHFSSSRINESFFGNIKNLFLNKVGNSEDIETESENEKIKIKKVKYVTNDFIKLFLTAVDTWKFNKILGGGIKSFRVNCWKLTSSEYNLGQDNIPDKKNRLCSNHPHNYYFEILTETGIIGIIIAILIGALLLFFIVKKYKFFNKNSIESLFLLASTIALFVTAFPVRSTGSVFSTNNTILLILFGSIILSHKNLLIDKKIN